MTWRVEDMEGRYTRVQRRLDIWQSQLLVSFLEFLGLHNDGRPQM